MRNEETRLHLHDAHKRIMSIAAMQKQLEAGRHGEPIACPYLTRLCETLAGSMIGERRPITLEVYAQAGSATSEQAVSMGLIVTELVLNALKHAFPDDSRKGSVLAAYDVAGSSWRLTVSDNGIGRPDENAPKIVPGLGTNLIEALATAGCPRSRHHGRHGHDRLDHPCPLLITAARTGNGFLTQM